MNKTVKTITKTAICLALLVVLQYVTKLTGIQLITGSVVNLVLILSVYLCGLWGGLVVAATSPFVAFILGITPFPSILIVLAILLGNCAYVTIFHFIFKLGENKSNLKEIIFGGIGIIIGAIVKCILLYLVVNKLLVPFITGSMPSPQAAKVSAAMAISFGITQLFTALIGGAISLVLIKVLPKSLKN